MCLTPRVRTRKFFYRLGLRISWTDEVYFARDILAGEDVVVKLEPVKGKAHTLNHEFQVYAKLNRGGVTPRAHWFGREAGFDAMVTERLGPSLGDLFVQYHFRFTLRTVLLLAGQLVSFSF